MRSIITTLLAVYSLLGIAQNYEISGRTTDKSSNDILPFVNIFLDNEFVGTSNTEGLFKFEAAQGEHQLKFSSVGFLDLEKSISVQKKMELNIALEASIEQLNQVVITASRMEQKLSDVTVSMEVIQPDLIQNNNTTSLEKLIEQTSGVAIINGQANIRGGGGFSYGAGSRVLVLVDDVPVIRPGVGDVMWDYLPTEDIEQIEVIKGASSALYGASALNGVINIRTARASDKPLTKIRLFSGWYDDPAGTKNDWYPAGQNHPTYSGISFSHLQRIKTHDFAFSGNALSDAGYLDGGDRQKVRLSFRSKFRPPAIPGLIFGLNGNVQYTDAGQFLIWNDDTTGQFRPLDKVKGRLTYRQYSVDPHLTYQKGNGKFTYNGKYFLVDSASLIYSEFQYQHVVKFLTKYQATLTGGIVNNYTDVSVVELGEHKSNEVAAYLQADLDLGRLKLSAGVRGQTYALDTSEVVKATVFRTGANFRLTKSTFLRSSYGQGFRYPSMAEKFIRFSAAPLEIYPNETLNPEKGESAELGIKQSYNIGKFNAYADVAVFWAQYQDMMEFQFGLWGSPFVDSFFGLGFKSVNAGLGRIKGVEVNHNITGSIKKLSLHMNVGYTYIYPEDRTVDQTDTAYQDKDEYLKYRFAHIGKMSFQGNYKKWTSGLNMRYYSFMENIDEVFEGENPIDNSEIVPGLKRYREENQDGDWIWDYNLGFQVNESTSFQFIIKNIVNTNYALRPALPDQPRTFVVQYSGKF